MKNKMLLAGALALGSAVLWAAPERPAPVPMKQMQSVKMDDSAWMTDFKAAQELSKKTGKPILMDFTGSDWCPWCVSLDKEVFSQPEFQEYAKQNLILLKLDFPRKKKLPASLHEQNQKLAKKYDIDGFPTVLLMNAEGTILVRTGYRRGGAQAYVAYLKTMLNQ